MSHRNWRKIAKKERRRRIRIKNAIIHSKVEKEEQLCKELSPNYLKWVEENEKLTALKILEEDRIREDAHQKWLQTELIAQIQWRELQAKIMKAKEEKAVRDLKIKQEWDNEQKKLKEAEEKIWKEKLDREAAQRELDIKITQYLNGIGEIPNELLIVVDTKLNTDPCPFFTKTGVCRFGSDCSRNHRKPTTSKILLIQNFYTNFVLEHSKPNEYDTDVNLEYDEVDAYQDFRLFFNDVLPEFEKFGEVVQFKVCCNRERHLRGNTYIEYSSTKSAIKAHRSLNARWYGGRQLSLQFCSIFSWRSAICGLANGNRCPKGLSCNFLHVYQNPGNRFDITKSHKPTHSDVFSSHRSKPRKENRKNWRWSESPEIEIKEKNIKRTRRSRELRPKENRQRTHLKK